MRKTIIVFILLILSGGQASTETCPEFFRFVDFGLNMADGPIRGGPTYRAEGFDGQALLLRERTVCRDVRHVAVDGRGNPIPVVTSVSYDPAMTGMSLTELRLTGLEDVASATEQSAAPHRSRLERETTLKTRGPDYLCASLEDRTELSCQFMSPFGGNLALVVYCDPLECRMPALAVNEQIIATASWPPSHASASDHTAAALEIARKIKQLHDFLAPLSSWKPDFKRFDG